ncbi:type VII secretion protein EccE [Hamadaea sp. NPDC051192]|uniref:type VII secretion protein EccE n=1 Tax=Hamadaea sp. NPDC051192 TaxID=3154940 RepID=UPI0034277478
MTVGVVHSPTSLQPTVTGGARRRSNPNRVHSGQIVATELAVALLLVGLLWGVVPTIGLAVVAAALIVLAWARLRGRWLFQWMRIWLSYRTHRRSLAPGSDGAALLQFVRPGVSVDRMELDGEPGAVIAHEEGLTAVLEIGDDSLLPSGLLSVPSPAGLLPPPAPNTPRFRVQLVYASVPVGGPGAPAQAYRQLTEGRLPASERMLIAVHVPAAEGWEETDLRRALSGVIRKVRRKLDTIPSRVLDDDAALRTVLELAAHDGANPVREAWSGVTAGGLLHASYRVRRWPDLRTEAARDLVTRLMAIPARAVTVSLTAGPWTTGEAAEMRTDLVVRLTAADQTSLTQADTALHRVLGADRAAAHRLDGEHLEGFCDSLPLGGSAPADMPTEVEHGISRPAAPLTMMRTPIGSAGLMIGPNRRREPVSIRIFRPQATRAMLVGGTQSAQLLTLRALALGARVVVQTARPPAWERFFRNLGGPNDSLAIVAPGQPLAVPPATQLRPLMMVVDVGPVGADRSAGHPWQTTLVVREDLSPVDIDALGHADIALLQPTTAEAAALAVSVLGLSDNQREALSRPVPGLIGVVHRRSVRWASLGTAPMEQQLLA